MKRILHKFIASAIMLIALQITLTAQPVGSQIKTDTSGHISYWNGVDSWIAIAPGLPGQTLIFTAGVPSWVNNPNGITTTAVSNITGTSAISGGNILSDGGATITARGVCWSTSANPTVALNTKTADGTGIGSFTSNITGLLAGTTYFVRAYATNSEGTAYGNEVSFTTLANLPTLTTTTVTAITSATATSGGNITSDGGAAVTARGVCWSTSANPTVALNTKTTDGTGIGSFTSSITGLAAITHYYVRAYATNSAGTTYGNEVSFTTLANMPTLTTTAATAITTATSTSGGNITSDGGAAVTARGVCWSTSANPTVALNTKTTDGTGIGSFTSSITGLAAGTLYYVRAYATNSAGTAYGNGVSFTTTAAPITTVTDYDGNVYDIVAIGPQFWMKQNLKTTHYKNGTTISYPGTDNTAWGNNTNGAYAWYNNNEVTYKNTYGALYNFSAVNTGNLCPTGWHVPTDDEWTTLTTYLGGESSAGGQLKATSLWNSPNTGATNETGFTALPGGYRDNSGIYNSIGSSSNWWSSTDDIQGAWSRGMGYSGNNVSRNFSNMRYGFPVRCLMDLGAPTITTAATSITSTTVTSGGNITSDGGTAVTARGVCWSTSANPTVALNTKTTDGTGIGSFTSSIIGLVAGTIYYVRAYATNSAGTAYGNEVSFTNTAAPINTVTDYDGNVYDIVAIGTQFWMKQNLKTTHYKNGTAITFPFTDNNAWLNNTSGAYAWYNNNAATYKNTYGALYNWYAVNTGNLCPTGWHVPTDDEWTTLTTYLGGAAIAGGKLKEAGLAHWTNPNTGATNQTGFTALPGGDRYFDGSYSYIGEFGYWWSSSVYGTGSAWCRIMYSDGSNVDRTYYGRDNGFSVRCLRD